MRERNAIMLDNKDYGGGGSSALMLEVMLDVRSLLISLVKKEGLVQKSPFPRSVREALMDGEKKNG